LIAGIIILPVMGHNFWGCFLIGLPVLYALIAAVLRIASRGKQEDK